MRSAAEPGAAAIGRPLEWRRSATDGIFANTLNVNDDNITLEISSDALRIKGISATAAGDLLIGAAANAGYTALAKPSTTATAYTYLLSMDSSGNARWADTLDGGTF